ncbi:hypothetical protein BN13_1540007 [Nostocoides jenkinsii Ben 74]|uniref:Uncharacterized protein n=1 Tax=Nostocoides jenkinsii Ben 74 TaxID=1193518 RepID=A0A077M4S1_9MICO|nr:hypothetical protein BN13_1540007 [Tetrasphaera jenkinsii Ben 74]
MLVQVALSRVLERIGMRPRAVDGAGFGLVTAGVVAGVLDLAAASDLLTGTAPVGLRHRRSGVSLPAGGETLASWAGVANASAIPAPVWSNSPWRRARFSIAPRSRS